MVPKPRCDLCVLLASLRLSFQQAEGRSLWEEYCKERKVRGQDVLLRKPLSLSLTLHTIGAHLIDTQRGRMYIPGP